jgi:hypothetical protein
MWSAAVAMKRTTKLETNSGAKVTEWRKNPANCQHVIAAVQNTNL